MVAPVEDGDSRPVRHVAADPDHPAVGVGGREGELPVRKPEAACQLGAHPRGVLGREHRGDALDLADHPHRGLRGVARHRAGVAEAEVGVLVAVNIDDRGPVGALLVEREAAHPHRHPGHRDAAQEAAARLGVQLARARILSFIGLALALDQGCELPPAEPWSRQRPVGHERAGVVHGVDHPVQVPPSSPRAAAARR